MIHFFCSTAMSCIIAVLNYEYELYNYGYTVFSLLCLLLSNLNLSDCSFFKRFIMSKLNKTVHDIISLEM